MVIQKLIFPCVLLVSSLSEAATVTFDLQNLPISSFGGYSLKQDGVGLTFFPENSASQLVSTAWGIGVDSGYTGEASGFINGKVKSGAGAEALGFMFSKDVVIQSITLVWNSVGVVPIISPKGVVSQDTVLGNGSTTLPGLKVGGTSANEILHSTNGYFPASGGFAIKSITVATIPEPTPTLLGLIGGVLSLALRRRRVPAL